MSPTLPHVPPEGDTALPIALTDGDAALLSPAAREQRATTFVPPAPASPFRRLIEAALDQAGDTLAELRTIDRLHREIVQVVAERRAQRTGQTVEFEYADKLLSTAVWAMCEALEASDDPAATRRALQAAVAMIAGE